MLGCYPRSKCKSALMLVLGVLFLLGTMNVWAEFTFAKYWPLFLVLWGLHGLFCGCDKKCSSDGKCDDKGGKNCDKDDRKAMSGGCCKG